MKLRPLGNTGISVSEIGLGAWQLANPDWHVSDEREAQQIVEYALEAGCTFFDTAPGYGDSRSETILGRALREVRQEVVICTKFSHHDAATGRNFSVENLRPVLEGSLRRLQTDYVDVLLLHNPPRELMDGSHAPQYAALEALKAEGLIRAYGVSLDWQAELELVTRTTASQAVEVMFNAFHQEPKGAFREAQARGVGLIVKVPLDSGWLSGSYRHGHRFTDIRGRWSPEVVARRSELLEKFAALIPEGTSLVHAALGYVLAQPEVSTVIPGSKTLEQAKVNFAAAESHLPQEVVQKIDALWEQEIKDQPLPW